MIVTGALATDLYELNMAASYLRRGMTDTATFSLFVRRLPPGRGFSLRLIDGRAQLSSDFRDLHPFRLSCPAAAVELDSLIGGAAYGCRWSS